MTQTDLTGMDEPQAPPVTQGPEVPQPDVEYQQLLEKAKTGDVGARGQLRQRLLDPSTDPGTRQQITSALQVGVTEEAAVLAAEDRYRPLWFGDEKSQVSLGRLRNAEMLGRTKLSPEFLERQEAGAAGFIETAAETFVLPPARMISIALGVPDVDVDKRTKELGNEIEFLEQRILPKAVEALKAGHSAREVIDGLKAQGIEADRALGESIDDAFAAEGFDTKAGYARLFSSPGELFIQRVKQLPEKEFGEILTKRDVLERVPLVGTLLQGADQNRQEEAINRVAEGKGTEEDNMLLEALLIDQYRARSTGYKAVEGIMDMAGFGADLFVGGAIGKGAGRLLGAAAKGVGLAKFNKALANVAEWSAKTPNSMLSRAGRAATRGTMAAGRVARETVGQVAGEAIGSAAVTGAADILDAGPDEVVLGRAELETQRRRILESISGGIDPESGEAFFAVDRIPEDAPEIDASDAVALTIDVAIEKVGRFVNLPNLSKTPAARRRMVDAMARAVDPALADRVRGGMYSALNKLQIDSFVGEVFEEYASRTGQAVIGEVFDDPDMIRMADIIPAGEAIADEMIAIFSGTTAMRAPGMAAEALGAAGVTPRGRQRLERRTEYLRDVEAAATDPAAAERVRQTNEATRRATGEEVEAVLSGVGGTRVDQPEGVEAEEAAERAAALGIELVFFEGPAEQSGFYDRTSPSTIYINTKAEDAAGALEIETTVHEIAHDMEAVIGEDAFGSLVGKLRDADPERFDEAKEDAEFELEESLGEAAVARAAESEVAASRAEDNGVLVDLLLRSPDVRADIQRILQTDQSLLERMRDGVRQLLSILPGVKTAKAKGLQNLRSALEQRGLQGADLETALEQAELTTADEVSAAMIDVAEMRQLARRRQREAYMAGAVVRDEELYGTDEEFEEAIAEPEPVEGVRAVPSPIVEPAVEEFLEREAERPEGQPLPVRPTEAPIEPSPVMPGARVRINPDSVAFDETIGQAQDIAGLEVVDVTGPAGAQRVRLRVPGESGFTIVPESDVSLAQPAPGQPAIGDMPFAETPTVGAREAQERTQEDIELGRTRFARRRRRRRKPPEVLDRFDVEPPTWREKFRISLFDRLARLERFERDAYKEGLRLAKAESPTLAARLMPGKTTYKQERLETNYIDPILNVLSAAGISLPQFEDFLILRTTKESNEDLRRKRAQAEANRQQARNLTRRSKEPIDRDLPAEVKDDLRKQREADKREAKRLRKEADFIDPGQDPKSYYTDEEAEAKLAQINKDPKRKKELEEAGRLVDEMNAATRKQLLDSGLISQEQHDQWTDQFKHYVPFKTEEAESSWTETGTSGYSVRGPEAMIRRGTTRKPNPLLFSFQQASRAIVRGEKNQVGVRAYKFFQKANMLADVQELEPGQEMPDLRGSPRFGLKIDGEQKVVTLKDEYLARALKNMGPQRNGDPGLLDKFIERAAKVTRFMANANTQYNPDFLLVNPIRDQIEAQLKVGELRERGFNLTRTGLLADSFGAYKFLKAKPGTQQGPMADIYRRFGEAGGLIRLQDMQDYQESTAALEAKLQRMAASQSRNPVSQGFHWVGELISRRNRALELSVRLSVFKQLVERGATDAKAAEVARDITVDFNRRGQDTAAINSLYMFFNASMQGTDRNLRAMKTKAGRRTMAALMMAGYAHSMLAAAGSDEDEDGRLEWDNEKWYNKARNLVIGIGGGKILKLPLPYLWSLGFFAGQLLESVTRGVMDPGEAGTLMAANILNDMTPLQFGSEPNTFFNKGLAAQLLPSAMQPIGELIVNRDYRGEAILRERFPGETTPARERGTSDWVVSNTVAEVLADLTGQDALDVGGPFDWNPDAIEALYDEFTGGAGASIGRVLKVGQAAFAGRLPEIKDVPLLRRFAGIGSYGGVRTNYFDLKERSELVIGRYRAFGKKGDRESQQYIVDQDPTAYRFARRIRSTEKRRKALYEKRNAAETPEERQAIEAQIDDLLGRVVEDFDKTEASR